MQVEEVPSSPHESIHGGEVIRHACGVCMHVRNENNYCTCEWKTNCMHEKKRQGNESGAKSATHIWHRTWCDSCRKHQKSERRLALMGAGASPPLTTKHMFLSKSGPG